MVYYQWSFSFNLQEHFYIWFKNLGGPQYRKWRLVASPAVESHRLSKKMVATQ